VFPSKAPAERKQNQTSSDKMKKSDSVKTIIADILQMFRSHTGSAENYRRAIYDQLIQCADRARMFYNQPSKQAALQQFASKFAA
jgi:hypothetical protein